MGGSPFRSSMGGSPFRLSMAGATCHGSGGCAVGSERSAAVGACRDGWRRWDGGGGGGPDGGPFSYDKLVFWRLVGHLRRVVIALGLSRREKSKLETINFVAENLGQVSCGSGFQQMG